MRITLLAFVLAIAGCASKKPKPAAAPMAPAATESGAAPGGGSPDRASDPEEEEDTMKGDPCDGGETKKK
jgi:hypothetical protein